MEAMKRGDKEMCLKLNRSRNEESSLREALAFVVRIIRNSLLRGKIEDTNPRERTLVCSKPWLNIS